MDEGGGVRVLVVPWDSGRRAWRMGQGPLRLEPLALDALSRAGLGSSVVHLQEDDLAGEPAPSLGKIVRAVGRHARAARDADEALLVLSGNCGATLGAVAYHRETPAVVWLDAHGDLNTPETSPSGFLDGMALATLTGRARTGIHPERPVPEERVILFDARDLDEPEEAALDGSPIRRPGSVAQAEAEILELQPPVHLHLDLDVIDARAASANSYAVPGGPSVEEVLRLVRTAAPIAPTFTLSAYDPGADRDGRAARAAAGILEATAHAWARRRVEGT